MGKNVLFIMCDQLRYDYLSCAGHPHLHTPNIDSLAERGVRFTNAYAQSPICGPSRMSFYTGRYVRSHGSTWNMFPLRIGEQTLGDHLKPLGVRTVLCGKTHMTADIEGMKRLGIDPTSEIGAHVSQCGFEVWDRLDGVHPTGGKKPTHYNDHLWNKGYDGENPWQDWANSGEDETGSLLSGWLMENAQEAARVDEADSETTYTTTRAIEFIKSAGEQPWCLHLSYIKPHWPYIAPAPYNDMYGDSDVVPPCRSEDELVNAHPILGGFRQHRVSQVFCRPGVRETVIPAYMGLIKQIDDQVGRLLAYLKETGADSETLIVFTSDHGDYLGDHWLGEKELFHDCSVKIPLIVVDPSREAGSTRGQENDTLVEAIDLVPSFIDFFGGEVPNHVIEGQSLLDLTRKRRAALRDCVISEYDYSPRKTRELLDQPVGDSRLIMAFDGRYKLVHAEGFRPMLYDLQTDPQELNDLGESNSHSAVRQELYQKIFKWARQHHNRTTISDDAIKELAGEEFFMGVKIGFWDQSDVDEAIAQNHGGN